METTKQVVGRSKTETDFRYRAGFAVVTVRYFDECEGVPREAKVHLPADPPVSRLRDLAGILPIVADDAEAWERDGTLPEEG